MDFALVAAFTAVLGFGSGPTPRPASAAGRVASHATVTILPLSREVIGSWRPQVIEIAGEFGDNLYGTLAAALPDSLLSRRERTQMAWEIADVFRWQTDFTRELHPGDRYSMVFERLVSTEGEVRFGRLLAAELSVGGRRLSAYEFDDAGGRTSYYDGEGASLRRSFLRVPVEFRRISSGFSESRFHPILKMWRKHEGIDYAAAPGSPVFAVAGGVVLQAGWAGAYGRLVEIRHPNGVITRYGHLRGFARNLRAGDRVIQGQCIGSVGATGLATGPHLHFEFRLNGGATDPSLLDGDPGAPISGQDRPVFQQTLNQLRRLLPALPIVLASGQG